VVEDLGKTWTETPHRPAKPLFSEPIQTRRAVKIGSPHFVDFGRNMEHSPDGKAYSSPMARWLPTEAAHRQRELDHRRSGLFASRDAVDRDH